MHLKHFWKFCLFIFFLIPISVQGQLPPPSGDSGLNEPDWNIDRVNKGIYWKAYHGDDFFDAKLSINLVEVWLDSTEDAQFKIGYSEEKLHKTSEFGEIHDALIAINGSFFDMENAGSTVFIKSEGEIFAEGAPNNQFYSENGALAWNSGHSPVIVSRPEEGWKSIHHHHENIFSSGPLLISNGELSNFNSDPFHQNRHPRTAVALTDDNRFLFITVDGRSFQSYGITIPELANFLQTLGAIDALNFDGGGSTSMWISGKNDNGIVNYPSDNMEFDNLGERNIANALLLLQNQ